MEIFEAGLLSQVDNSSIMPVINGMSTAIPSDEGPTLQAALAQANGEHGLKTAVASGADGRGLLATSGDSAEVRATVPS